ncbi:MAG: VCBS repeat-containing protein [Flavisolibacter sp.]
MPLRGLPVFYLTVFTLSMVSCHKSEQLFESLPSTKTNIRFENRLEKRPLFGILYYLYYYNGGGVATGDINNDGLPDIYFTANSKGHNKLYLNKGNFQFEDITDKAGVAGTSDWCSGVTMADINGDGYMDIYVSAVANHHGLKGHNELFINNGNGSFTESAAKYGLDFSGFTTQAVFFDYDHDGDLDCYILNQSHQPNQNIVDTSKRRKFDPYAGDRLYRNDLNGPEKKFTDVSAQAGIYQSSLGYGLGLAVADINNDGWEDIYIGNDFHENDYYYVNNGNGTFTESGAKVFNHYSRFSMGNDVADYNNDGQLDLMTVDMLPGDEKTLKTYGSDENADIYKFKIVNNGYQYQYSKNCLQRNNGNGTSFSETSLLSGVSATDWSWSPLFADFDNDGIKDLFISSGIVKRPVDLDYIKFVSNLYIHKGLNTSDKYDQMALDKMPDGSSHPFLFKGDGSLGFRDMSNEWGTEDMKGYFNGASYADLDNDGNLDLVVNCIDAPALILKNNAPKKNYLSLSFKGEGLNTMGIGAKAYIFSRGKLQYQQLMLTRGFQSSSDCRLHFGLNDQSLIDSLLVVWPDQKYQLLKHVKANQNLRLEQRQATGSFHYAQFFPPGPDYFSQLTDINLPWKHRENDFEDYNVQYLIPHSESTRGPKIAVADVNGDGLDDLYACGAKGQPGTLLVQQADGSFLAADTTLFGADAAGEDVDALFFDANGDKKPDLYVVTGGNEYTGKDPALTDRLYINDGQGHFTKSSGLPLLYANKSCVTAADIDHDGDMDLFVGNLADPRAYGIPQTSYLLINDGRGNFSVAGQDKMPLAQIGMVTSAVFADVNQDGWPDLVVAGEWMPLTVFINHGGNFIKNPLAHTSGWWQSLYLDDVNGDGKLDILAGNWGWNNKFEDGKNSPVKLYVADFDKNGQTDQLLSYMKKGEEYPFLAKDEMEKALPVLRKHYLLYSDYAGLPMKDAFYGFAETVEPLVAERLGSVVSYGDGKGGFKTEDLPSSLQLAPIFSFQKTHTVRPDTYLAGGNFFDVIPYEGRYDAQPLALFQSNKNGIRYLHQPDLIALKGQVRDIKWMRTAKHGRVLVVARNNEPLLFFGKHNE